MIGPVIVLDNHPIDDLINLFVDFNSKVQTATDYASEKAIVDGIPGCNCC